MKQFRYTAKDKTGKNLTGIVEASTREAAVKLLRDRGLIVIKIAVNRGSILDMISNFKNRVTQKDISAFTRQFSTMVNAGLPVTESLTILRSQSKATLQAVISQILADVEGGESLSTALSRHPNVFSSTYIALVKAGEAGGVLDNVLARLSDDLEKQQEFKGKVQGALIYPAIIVVGMIIVAFVMMVFVVPKMTSLYTEFGKELPLPTKILIGLSDFAITAWPLLLTLTVLGVWGGSLYIKTEKGKKQLDSLTYKIPIFGELQKQVTLTELTRTLALMVGSGVSILESMSIVSGVVKNSIISDALKDASEKIEKGFPVAFSFAKHPEAFPYLLSQMIAVGEETGKMEEVLNKVSRIFEVESDIKVKSLTSAIEPIVMIILGVGVGFLVIAVILPIYNLTSQF